MNEPDHISAIANFFHDQRYTDWFVDQGRREANKKIKEAMNAGTAVDLAIQTLSMLTEADLPQPKKFADEISSACKAWQTFVGTYEPRITASQKTLVNEEQNIIGTLDFEFNDDEICDLKYATAIRPSYWIQLGGYSYLNGSRNKKVSVLRIDKSSDMYEYTVREDVGYLVQVFISTLNLFRFWKGN